MFANVQIKDLGSSPAAVNHITGELYLSPKFFRYPKDWQAFIIWHEWSHYRLNTKSELEADANALRHYAKRGRPLDEAVRALACVLDMQNPAHRYRAQRVLAQAKNIDNFFNSPKGDKEARMSDIQQQFESKEHRIVELLQQGMFEEAETLANEVCDMLPKEEQAAYWDEKSEQFKQYRSGYDGADLQPDEENEYAGADIEAMAQMANYIDYIVGLNGAIDADIQAAISNFNDAVSLLSGAEQAQLKLKKSELAIKKKEDANARKNTRVNSKAAVREGRASKLTDTGAAKLELAVQGISTAGELAKGLGGAVKEIGGMFGKKNVPVEETQTGMSDPMATQQTQTTTDDKKGLPMWAWILIILAIIAAVGGGIWMFVRKKA